MGISLKPSTATQGGLFQDVDVRVEKCRATVYDYNGKVNPPTLSVHMTLQSVDSDTVEELYLGAGALNRFAPSESVDGEPLTSLGDEGKFIVAAEGSTATALSKSSNFMFFLTELTSAGYPEDRIEEDLSSFEGMVFHAIRKPAPKREGMNNAPAEGARVPTVLVPSKILKYPWDAKGKAKGAAAGGGKGVDAGALAVAALKDVLAKNDGTITPADAKKIIFPKLVQDKTIPVPVRNEVVALIVNTGWLSEQTDGFAFDGTNIIAA